MQVDLSQVKYAGFWDRFFAVILDLVVMMLVFIPLTFYFIGFPEMTADGTFNVSTDSGGLGSSLTNYFFPLVVTVIFWKYKSATPGKMMMGIYIVDADTGGVPMTGRLILRYFAYLVSMFFMLGFIWVAFDKRKQSFHDKIAKTVVVKLNKEALEEAKRVSYLQEQEEEREEHNNQETE